MLIFNLKCISRIDVRTQSMHVLHVISSETNIALRCRPFVEPNTTDHDDGVEGMIVQRTEVVRPKKQYQGGLPAHAQAQIHKDKNAFSLIVSRRPAPWNCRQDTMPDDRTILCGCSAVVAPSRTPGVHLQLFLHCQRCRAKAPSYPPVMP